MSRDQPRTLLEQLAAADLRTWPELTERFLAHARDLHRESGFPMASLSSEHLQRIAAGKITRPHPATARVLQRQFGRPIHELLGPPETGNPADSVGLADRADRHDGAEDIQRSQREWLRVRPAPGVRGRELTELAAWLYPRSRRAPGGHVLAGPGWLLDQPVDLGEIRTEWSDAPAPAPVIGPRDHVLPLTERGHRYSGYSRAVRDLVRPRLLENRPSFRLLRLRRDDEYTLTFTTTTFFDVFDVKQSLAHEFKAAWLAGGGSVPGWDALPLRAGLGDPFDPSRLLMSPGISTLTIRRDRAGEHRFVLHERDGNPEHDGSTGRSVDYGNREPFRSFQRARDEGRFRVWHYGIVLEPLELGAVQLTVAVIDGETFDQLFAGIVGSNDEGHLVGRDGRSDIRFSHEAIERLDPRLSASALTLLRLAWRDRRLLLG